MDTTRLFELSIHHEINKPLANNLLPIAKKFLNQEKHLTNEWGYKNTYSVDLGLAGENELDFFVNYVLDLAYTYMNKKHLKLKENLKLWVSIFASEMFVGDRHSYHDHPGSLISGLIYLQVPPGSSNLEFFNPRSTNRVWSELLDENTYAHETDVIKIKNNQNIEIKPTTGLLLFWESWADHQVLENQSKEGRITMVFNVGVDNERV